MLLSMGFKENLKSELEYRGMLVKELAEELELCAEESTKLDRRMLVVRKKIQEASESED